MGRLRAVASHATARHLSKEGRTGSEGGRQKLRVPVPCIWRALRKSCAESCASRGHWSMRGLSWVLSATSCLFTRKTRSGSVPPCVFLFLRHLAEQICTVQAPRLFSEVVRRSVSAPWVDAQASSARTGIERWFPQVDEIGKIDVEGFDSGSRWRSREEEWPVAL